MDLLDMGGPSPSAAGATQPGGSGIDLLGDVFGSAAPANTAAGGAFNLGGVGTAPTPPPAPAAPVKPYTAQVITTADFGGAWGGLPMEK